MTRATRRKDRLMKADATALPVIFSRQSEELLKDWMEAQLARPTVRSLMKESELREQSREFITLLRDAVGRGTDLRAPQWVPVREVLGSISRSRAAQGYTPAETASFVISFKQALMGRLRSHLQDRPAELFEQALLATELIDELAMITIDAYQQSREEVVRRQQEELLELSTPVVALWDGILALPLIGTLDSSRTNVVMESLLQAIVDSGASIAIIDITGVPTVDTLVAQHLLKTVAAARLMGADCIISGIRPQIAQTIVHLGVDLSAVSTRATLADAFRLALSRVGSSIQDR
jgi:rsbT co-antagonist protein RsbR